MPKTPLDDSSSGNASRIGVPESRPGTTRNVAPETNGPDAIAPETNGPDANGPDANGPDGMVPDVMVPGKSVRSKQFLSAVAVILVLVVATNVYFAKRNHRLLVENKADAALLRDTNKVRQSWSMLPDGMQLVAEPIDPNDVNALANVRRYLKRQRTEYLRANYSDAKFGKDDIPGRADLEYGTANDALNCEYKETAGGASLRWIAMDGSGPNPIKGIVLEALKQWATKVGTSPVK